MKQNRQGFTLIEMLVVIAIIAVLVSIIIPVVGASTTKAAAAADAANLRSVLGSLNAEIASTGKTLDELTDGMTAPKSKMNPDAALKILYTNPGFIEVYYVVDDDYYGLDYLSQIAANGRPESEDVPGQPGTDGTWYTVSTG